ncbi:hypothetical protein GIB67_013911 [Kingdonia uniflora]|uniref:Uncharacterized protein n=1 Tax=Kingdonia uniflora TaxID=39325 RepID=A0A7J7LDF2_9MAGN|nr:hypothetical protein GIB67_013911 [Kingdonia uniflora]
MRCLNAIPGSWPTMFHVSQELSKRKSHTLDSLQSGDEIQKKKKKKKLIGTTTSCLLCFLIKSFLVIAFVGKICNFQFLRTMYEFQYQHV